MGNSDYDHEAIEDTQKNRFLTFQVDKEFYGIEIMYVTEIVGLQPITLVPELPNFITGIINLRGQIIPVMDARIKFKKNSIAYNDRTCIIVIDVKDLTMGIVVDVVSEVLEIKVEDIVAPPKILNGGRKYIKAIGKNDRQVILLLDCNELLNEDEIEEIKGA